MQFEGLPSACPPSEINFVKMYLYYVYADKAGWYAVTFTTFIPRYMQVHLMKEILAETQATSSKHYSGTNWSSPWLVWLAPTQRVPQEWNPVTIMPWCLASFVEFYIASAVTSSSNGVPNYGVVIDAVNELETVRAIHFANNSYEDFKMRPFVTVLCAK